MTDTPLQQSRFSGFVLLLHVLGGCVLLFILAPLFSLLLHSSPEELIETAAEAEVRRSIWLTLWTSMAATLLMAVAAVPFAYLLARRPIPLKGFINAAIDLPIVIPHSAAGIALLTFFSQDSIVGGGLTALGLPIIGTKLGIMAAMAFVSLPFLINSARDGFHAVPERLEKAALNLGASPARVFLTVALPLAWRPVLTGLILMWARGMSEFGAVMLVAYHPMITPVLIWERFGQFGLRYTRPVAILFIFLCLLLFTALRLLAWRNTHARR